MSFEQIIMADDTSMTRKIYRGMTIHIFHSLNAVKQI
jgi:hypothetical protein